jgi:hypothetical protein
MLSKEVHNTLCDVFVRVFFTHSFTTTLKQLTGNLHVVSIVFMNMAVIELPKLSPHCSSLLSALAILALSPTPRGQQRHWH